MKRLLSFGVLCGVLTLLLCVSAFAKDVTEPGLYGLATSVENVTLTAGKGAGEQFVAVDAASYKVSVSNETLVQDDNGSAFYPDAESLKVEIQTNDTNQYLVFALSDDETPSKDNIVYIDQTTGVNSGTIVFYIYPNEWEEGTFHIKLSSTNGELAEIARVSSFIPYVPGDVNEDGAINSTDALWVLEATVGNRQLSNAAGLAADVNKDDAINSTDALWILEATVGNRTL